MTIIFNAATMKTDLLAELARFCVLHPAYQYMDNRSINRCSYFTGSDYRRFGATLSTSLPKWELVCIDRWASAASARGYT